MSETAKDILDREQISIFTGPRRLTAEEFRAHKAISTQIVQLTPEQLRAAFDIWQQFHRQYGEPLVGHLVHEHADIGTEFDAQFDIVLAAPEILEDLQGSEAEEKAAIGADFIKSNPANTSESLSLEKLARLVCSVVIEHEPAEKEVEKDRQELIEEPIDELYAELFGDEDLDLAALLLTTLDAAKQVAVEARQYGFAFEEKNGP